MLQFLTAVGPRIAIVQTVVFAILFTGLAFRLDFAGVNAAKAAETSPDAGAQTMPLPPATSPDIRRDTPAPGPTSNVFRLPELDRPHTRPDNGGAVANREQDGHFYFDTVADGVHVRMMFDTGASLVSLRSEDAARTGIDVSRLNYSKVAHTANGIAEVAPVTIASLTIGNITLRNVGALVAKPGRLNFNLLGQSFLARVAGYNVEGNQLVLRGGG
jgi:clan AA aspartic protease (TIGR02281 family)